MASGARNPEYDAAYATQRSHRDRMRAGYVLVSEERESGSEYSGSTCCYCSSCASSCSGDEYSGDENGDEEEGYWSDCSACWRRSAERRGRSGWRDGDDGSYVNGRRAAEGRDSRQDHHHHTRHQGQQQHRHDGRNETRQRDQQNTNNYAFRNNNNSSSNNGYNNAAEAPVFRGLVDRIVSTTRQLRQGQEHIHHLRSWIRVLEDIQRLQYANAERADLSAASASAPLPRSSMTVPVSIPAVAATMAARTGQGSSAATVLGRGAATNQDGAMRQTQAQAQAQAYPRGAARGGYFMSGGRSISTNRRRRLR
ncbi:hypothetical protein ACHAQJ_008777 [Trichoderma viride]